MFWVALRGDAGPVGLAAERARVEDVSSKDASEAFDNVLAFVGIFEGRDEIRLGCRRVVFEGLGEDQ